VTVNKIIVGEENYTSLVCGGR